MSLREVGILGGTFNPIHNGHISAAFYAKEFLGLSKVLFVPAGIPPHKALPEGSPSASQRLEMTKIAVLELPFAEVCDLEIRREGKSFTFDTVCELRNRYQNTEFFLIIGTDMFLSFDTWFKAAELAGIAKIAVVRREDSDSLKIQKKSEEYRKTFRADITIVPSPVFEISSTEVREDIRNGKGEKWVPRDVLTYITENKLYI